MQGEQAQNLPPDELRPAQLGIVWLGRVILGHISATIVDLAQRGFVITVAMETGGGTVQQHHFQPALGGQS